MAGSHPVASTEAGDCERCAIGATRVQTRYTRGVARRSRGAVAAGGREEHPMGDLLWPIVIVTFVGVVFLLVVSFIRIALADHDSAAEPATTTA
jgi:hypothetical protein